MILNHLSQSHLGVRLCLCTFDIEVPTPNSWDDRGPSMTRNELFFPYSLFPRSLFSCFWLSSATMPVFSQVFFPFFPLLPLHPVFLMLQALEWTCVPNCSDSVNLFLLQQSDLRKTCAAHFQSYPHSPVGIDNTSIFGLAFPNTAGFSAAIYWCFTRHCCWHRKFQFSTSIFDDGSEFFILRFHEEDTT